MQIVLNIGEWPKLAARRLKKKYMPPRCSPQKRETKPAHQRLSRTSSSAFRIARLKWHNPKNMSPTFKGRLFTSEPMDDKPVTDLPGVGPVLGKKLTQNGFSKANDVFNQLVTLSFDRERFKSWMKNEFNVTARHSTDCYECLCDWYYQFAENESENTNGDAPSTSDNNPKKRTSKRVAEEITNSKRKIAKYESSDSKNDILNASEKSDPIISFYITVARKVKTFPKVLQFQVENEVYGIINNAQMKIAEEESAVPAAGPSAAQQVSFMSPPQ